MSEADTLVARGLDALGKGLAPFVGRELQTHYGDRWWELGALPSLRGQTARTARRLSDLDVLALFNILSDQRGAVFQRTLRGEAFTYLTVLRSIRNRLAHKAVTPQPLTPLEAAQALDTMTLLLRAVTELASGGGDDVTEMARDASRETDLLAGEVRRDHSRESRSTGVSITHNCCNAVHPFDKAQAGALWWPPSVRCLIVGESPGTPGAPYFYDPLPEDADPEKDPVEVRRYLLGGLFGVRLIARRDLGAFRDAGLAFDHAIRCQLSSDIIKKEWRQALDFRSKRAHGATHLVPLINQVPRVWIMGRLARDAVRHVGRLANMIERKPLDPPYVIKIDDEPRFFVSRYLNRYAANHVEEILVKFREFFPPGSTAQRPS
jgi:hypothetical protein